MYFLYYLYNYLAWPITVVLALAFIFLVIAMTLIRGYISPDSATEKKDFVQVILVGLGAIVAVGSFLIAWSTLQQSQVSTQASLANSQEVAAQNAEADLLQSYLEQMSSSLAQGLRTTPTEDEKMVARIQTLAVLRALEERDRKRLVVRFLSESNLINKDDPVVDIDSANLVRANLSYIGLSDTYLQHTLLNKAKLKMATLRRSNLQWAELSGACLRNAGFKEANLYYTGLEDADLAGADLSGADLREAVGLTQEQINLAYGSAETKLPDRDDLTAPDTWSKSIEEQEEILKDEIAQAPEAENCIDKPI